MSMKRSKQRSPFGSRRDDDVAPVFARAEAAAPEKGWADQMNEQPDDAFAPWALSTRFQKGALLQHPKFGRGVVVDAALASIDVLFEAGKKKLGHAGGPPK